MYAAQAPRSNASPAPYGLPRRTLGHGSDGTAEELDVEVGTTLAQAKAEKAAVQIDYRAPVTYSDVVTVESREVRYDRYPPPGA